MHGTLLLVTHEERPTAIKARGTLFPNAQFVYKTTLPTNATYL